MIIAGGKLYDTCRMCGQLVRLNKPIFGGLHFCLTDEEIAAKRAAARPVLSRHEHARHAPRVK